MRIRFILWFALPLATAWVKWQQARILRHGTPLNEVQKLDAQRAGVLHPENVRLSIVTPVPLPMPRALQSRLTRLPWFPGEIAGMTLGYGIHLHPYWANSREILLHELVHVAQYERLGGVRPFLRAYLRECLEKGYPHGPLEREAILFQHKMRRTN